MVIVDPEQYLVDDIADFLNLHISDVLGLPLMLLRLKDLRSSKKFIKDNNIPTPEYRSLSFLENLKYTYPPILFKSWTFLDI